MATNVQIKFAKSLSQKKYRAENGLFVVEGEKLVGELLAQSRFQALEIYATPAWIAEHQTKCQSESRPIPLIETPKSQMERMTAFASASEVLAVVNIKTNDNQQITKKNGLSLYLDQIKDPGNMGTILRTADWYNIQRVFLSPECVDIFNPKTLQSTMGSVFRVPFEEISLKNCMQKHGFEQIVGAVLDGEMLSQSSIFPQNALLVIGSESHGIAPENREFLTQKITIPRYGHAESLNVAVACGILLNQWAMGL